MREDNSPDSSNPGKPNCYWIAHGTNLLRCAPEHVRPDLDGNEGEWRDNIDAAKQAAEQIRNRGVTQYLDLRRAPGPPDDQDTDMDDVDPIPMPTSRTPPTPQAAEGAESRTPPTPEAAQGAEPEPEETGIPLTTDDPPAASAPTEPHDPPAASEPTGSHDRDQPVAPQVISQPMERDGDPDPTLPPGQNPRDPSFTRKRAQMDADELTWLRRTRSRTDFDQDQQDSPGPHQNYFVDGIEIELPTNLRMTWQVRSGAVRMRDALKITEGR